MKSVSIFTIFIAFAICCFSCISGEEKVADVMKDARDIQKQINNAKEGETIVIEKGSYVGLLNIIGKKKLTIDFAESTLITQTDETIFIIKNSSDITIKGLTIYHDIEGVIGCFSNCFDVHHCKNMTFEKCDINGSGFIGVCINQSDVVIDNCIIHKCEIGVLVWDDNEGLLAEEEGKVVVLKDSEVTIKDTRLVENRYKNVTVGAGYAEKAIAVVSLNGETFVLNKDNYAEYRDDGGYCVLN